METWLIFAVISIFAAWFYNFTMKVAAMKNYNVSIINKYSYTIWIIFWLTLYVFTSDLNFLDNFIVILFLAFFNALFFTFSLFTRVTGMKNIDTVLFFPLYKTFWPIIVTIISILFFKEVLNIKEIIWIIIWISVPLLLITKTENKIQKNLFIWVLFVIFTAILTSLTSAINKEVMLQNYNFALHITLVSCFWLIFSFFTNHFNNYKNHKYNKIWVIKFSLLVWFFHFLSFFMFIQALDWNLAVVYTINSFSILIPIILSIFFYKEHFDLRKFIVIMLSIISILLFI